ncbi:MAG: bifunctional UDP-N-acetylmuramoyl-tripeptide:D-alanyl-D-alanine ligase/alanine racemase [Bacteroidetes bacterium]|nr:bifunctional UDP-N-acetylmuramoyl-tripeptide:D-alanyl-D-alanine ligase/alanine racemase [Bacteroidota bacterium]
MAHVPETLRQWCHGTWQGTPIDTSIEELATDSRHINEAAHTAFFAIRTARRDGHQFIQAAYQAGVRLFIISEPLPTDHFLGAGFILVKNTLQALQQIAAAHRQQFSIPVIGITGSNGKTIVKEWLFSALSEDRRLMRNPRSYNSQIGVALSAWLISEEDSLAILEAGISQPGEMEALERIIRPDIGIFTNIGEAHSEGFLSQRQKITEKLSLFVHTPVIIYCRDYTSLHEAMLQLHAQTREGMKRRLFSWSAKGDAELLVTEKKSEGGKTRIQALYAGIERSISIPFHDAASVENAIHVWCALLLLGLDDQLIAARMMALQSVEMRMQTHRGINGCTVINDAYNSDLTSLAISLDLLESQHQYHRRSVILSDMLQMGRPDGELYEEVASMIARRKVTRFIGIGPALTRSKQIFRQQPGLKSLFFKSTEAFLNACHRIGFEDEAILLKGARSFEFEQIDALLKEEVHQTVLSINLTALAQNLAAFRNRIGPDLKLMAMVKAFSYGSGSHEIASALQFAGTDYLTVAYTDEGVALRQGGITLPIMVMSPEASAFDRMIAWKLEPEIYNLRSLEAFIRIATALRVSAYPVHIKLDTGMHRLGFTHAELDPLITTLLSSPQLRVASIFSHLAAAEDPKMDSFSATQAEVFIQSAQKLETALGYTPIRHLCNTAGILRHPELHFDMVRLGLGLYGVDSTGILHHELQQIGTLRTVIAQIKELPAGEGIGYGHSDARNTPRRIATISIGYADGYPRALGHGRAHVLIHGQPAPTIGVICMDMCMVDITAISEAQEGDTAIVFGPELPLSQLAAWSDTIPYEIMTGISQRVKRVYVTE